MGWHSLGERSTIKICDMASYSQLETWTYQKSSREIEWSRDDHPWCGGTMTTKKKEKWVRKGIQKNSILILFFLFKEKITQNIKCHLLEDVLKKLQLDFWGWKMSLSKTIFLLGPPRTIHVASKKKVVAFMGL